MIRFGSIEEIKRANRAAGFHFFDAGAIRFFSSRIGRKIYGGRFFITSEQFIPLRGEPGPRCWTIREALPDGTIEDASDFQEYETREEAIRAVKELIRAEAGKAV